MRPKIWILFFVAVGLFLLAVILDDLPLFETDELSERRAAEPPPPTPTFQAWLYEGRVYLENGRFGEALQSYEKARQAARDDPAMVQALTELGLTFKKLGDFHQALSLYYQALEIARRSGEPEPAGRILHSIGACYTSLGELRLAMDALEQAFDARSTPWDRAVTLTALATLHDLEGDHDLAVAQLRQALVMRRSDAEVSPERRRRGRAATLDRLGTAAWNGGRLEVARRAYESSRSLQESAVVDSNLGRLLVELGEPDEALALLSRAQVVLAESGQRQAEAVSLLGIARARQVHGEPELARKALEQALQIVEDLRGEVFNPHLRSTFLAGHRVFYESAIHLEMGQHASEPRAGHHLRALELAERAKARSLLDLLLEESRSRRRAEDPGLEGRIRPLEDELNRLEHRVLPASMSNPSAGL